MVRIEANADDRFSDVRAIAFEVWPKTYGAILSKMQLDYMLEMMYSVSALQSQAKDKNHQFILAKEGSNVLGFASFESNCDATLKTKIHKIYLLSNQQGKGIGKLLLDYIAAKAKENGDAALFLNVNKYNPARHFYHRLGFDIVQEVVIDIGNGYVMDDFVMEKSL